MVNFFNSERNLKIDEMEATIVKANKYIPAYAYRQLSGNILESDFYHKYDKNSSMSMTNNIKNIRKCLSHYDSPGKIMISNTPYYFSRGMILDQNYKLLLLVVVEKEELKTKKFEEATQIVYYSSDFMTNPGLATLNRRLQKEILSTCYEKGIEVRVLNSSIMEKNTFARLFEVKKTKTLVGLEKYLQEVLPTFLFNEEEDIFIEKEKESQAELLSIEEEALLYDSDSSSDLIINSGGEINNYSISSNTGYIMGTDAHTSFPHTTTGGYTIFNSDAISSGSITIVSSDNNSISIRTVEPESSIELIDDTE